MGADAGAEPVEGRAAGDLAGAGVPAVAAVGHGDGEEQRDGGAVPHAAGPDARRAVRGARPRQAERGLPLPQHLRAQAQVRQVYTLSSHRQGFVARLHKRRAGISQQR